MERTRREQNHCTAFDWRHGRPNSPLPPSKDSQDKTTKQIPRAPNKGNDVKRTSGKKKGLCQTRVRLPRVILAAVVIMLVVGAVVAGIFISGKKKEKTETRTVVAFGEMQITNGTFSDDLLNPQTDSYRRLSGDFCGKMRNTFQSSELASDFTWCQVQGYRPGSIIVSFSIRLQQSAEKERMLELLIVVIKKELDRSGGEFAVYQATLLRIGVDEPDSTSPVNAGVSTTSPANSRVSSKASTPNQRLPSPSTTSASTTTVAIGEASSSTTPTTATTTTTQSRSSSTTTTMPTTTTTTTQSASSTTTTPTTTTMPPTTTTATTMPTTTTTTTKQASMVSTKPSATTATTSNADRSTEAPSDGSCKLPNCFRPNSGIPGGLSKDETPMFVYFTFDDAVSAWSNGFFETMFANSRRNPNGCPIAATHFNSYNYTVYSIVKKLYENGHEIGSHSITHRTPTTWWGTATKEEWTREIAGQRDNIHQFGGIPKEDVKGMRAPYLQVGGDTQFTMLQEEGFMYDATMSSNTDPPSWPFTLHHPEDMDTGVCTIKPCPTKPYNIWEVPLNVNHMDNLWTPKCAMIDGCRPNNKAEALTFLWDNFRRHYDASTKPPYGANMHAAWFAWAHNAEAMGEFIQGLLEIEDVWIVPIHKILTWIQSPTPLSDMNNFTPFKC